MQRISGLLDILPNIENIEVSDIVRWLGSGTSNLSDKISLENTLGNKLIYPQTVPQTPQELELDLALVKESVRASRDRYYEPKASQIYIPCQFLNRFGDLTKLVCAFIDGINPVGVNAICVKQDQEVVRCFGSVIKPPIINYDQSLVVWVDGRKFEVPPHSFSLIPTQKEKVELKFEAKSFKLSQGNNLDQMVDGGELGIIIDTR